MINKQQEIKKSLQNIGVNIENILKRKGLLNLKNDSKLNKNEWETVLNMYELDMEKVMKTIHFLKRDYLKRFDEIEKQWNNYTEFYQGYIYSTTLGIDSALCNFVKYLNYCNNYVDIINYSYVFKPILNIYTGQNLLKHFSYKNKNYIILGRNGSGKTKLLNRIKNDYFRFDAVVIPAVRNLDFRGVDNENLTQYSSFDLSNIFDDDNLFVNDILTYKLCAENKNISCEVKNIFDSLSFDRKMLIDQKYKKIMLYAENPDDDKYDISNGSDGEKSAFLFISLVLLCKTNSMVLIDEPENHMNNALLNDLFFKLEDVRKDITFIYCTHNVDFIEQRRNPKLIYLRQYRESSGELWELEDISSFESLSIRDIISISGTKKKVLYIESKKDTIDYAFYNNLFSDFIVIPVGSCDDVIANCKVIKQKNCLKLNREVYGIIDRDSRSQREIDKYKKNNVFVLYFEEIENLLIAPLILDKVCKKYNLENVKDKFKSDIVDYAIKHKNEIVSSYINKTYKKMQKTGKYNFEGNVNAFKNQVKKINDNNINEYILILQDFIDNFDKYLKKRDYEKILINIQNKGFLHNINKMGLRYDEYFNCVIDLIRNDYEFKNNIISKYFDNLGG